MRRILIFLSALAAIPAAMAQDPVYVFKEEAEVHNDPIVLTLTPNELEQIKPLHCACTGPGLKDRDKVLYGELFPALKLPYLRMHDVAHVDPGLHATDANHIFPLPGLDPSKRENYNFAVTDEYLRRMVATGTKPYWRLGSSIENMDEYHYEISVDNYKKFAEVCCNIIAHYNEGLWDGFHYGIEYWEIWNEPDNKHCWPDGDVASFTEMYITVSKAIKKRFPNIKVGGPAFCSSANPKCINFIEACRDADAPIDFFSYHNYIYKDGDDSKFMKGADRLRQDLDENGFKETEIHLNEWHPIKGWVNVNKTVTPDIASLITSLMTGFQDTPIDKAFFYTASSGGWGIMADDTHPNNAYYSLLAFSRLYDFNTRLELKSENIPDMSRAIAGKDKDGNAAVLLSLFNSGKRDITVDFSALGKFASAQIWLYDAGHKFVKTAQTSSPDGKLKLSTYNRSAIVFVKLSRKADENASAVHLKLLKEDAGTLKAVNGGLHGPSLKSAGNRFRDKFFPNMHIPYLRSHNEVLTNSGMRLVDVNQIFPLAAGDASGKDYYDFRATDDYVKQILRAGCKPYWCLSNFTEEKWSTHFGITPGMSAEKWAEVCSNIIAHYNEGKWGGMKLGIKYWEIWDSPDKTDCWGGSFEQYADFYIKVAKILKAKYPDIMIGGPSTAAYNLDNARLFIEKCKASGAPLDFYSMHYYAYNKGDFAGDAAAFDPIRKLLDENGFQKTELHLSAWRAAGKNNVRTAVLMLAYMMAWQEAPVDVALYNSVNTNEFGVYSSGGGNPFYYAFCAFADLAGYPSLLKVVTEGLGAESRVLAGYNKSGSVDLLLAAHSDRQDFVLDIDSSFKFSRAEIFVMDENNCKLEQVSTITNPGGSISFSTASSSAIVLVKLKK